MLFPDSIDEAPSPLGQNPDDLLHDENAQLQESVQDQQVCLFFIWFVCVLVTKHVATAFALIISFKCVPVDNIVAAVGSEEHCHVKPVQEDLAEGMVSPILFKLV